MKYCRVWGDAGLGRAHHSDHWRTAGLCPDDLLSQGGKAAAAGPQLAEEPGTTQAQGKSSSLHRNRGSRAGRSPWGQPHRAWSTEGHGATATLAPRARLPATPLLHQHSCPYSDTRGARSSHLFQLAVDMLHDQVDSHRVPAPWSEPKAKERDSLVRTTVPAEPETHFLESQNSLGQKGPSKVHLVQPSCPSLPLCSKIPSLAKHHPAGDIPATVQFLLSNLLLHIYRSLLSFKSLSCRSW